MKPFLKLLELLNHSTSQVFLCCHIFALYHGHFCVLWIELSSLKNYVQVFTPQYM